ncbi:hypothetical protein [Xanthocytophaga flava]|uniref:hypothetical protein n=1 Tax=Xanthocytophaga flava TaxID=3048013 RepID=UPI0028D61884|nr:hypothetical protein [Xanthocytophaga flavus]MDJ1466196.1 hypothetical protein [Xanthocytophaga flavus]
MIPIPIYIIDQLRSHIINQCPIAEAGWEFANQDEDTLTGDFFGRMRTNWEEYNNYTWRFYYNKIRGRGKGALEKTIGADGIITLHYIDQITKLEYYKSLVFQAKKENNSIDPSQWQKMNKFFPNGNIIISYGADGYNSYLESLNKKIKLCDIIADNFLNCYIGIEGLYYDHKENKFVRPNNIPIKEMIKHEVLIEVFKNP